MEHRKIIEFGKSSHVVSLPKEWMEQNKISKGDLVSVEAAGKRLIISSKEQEDEGNETRKTEIDVTNMSIFEIRLVLISKYVQNYNEITLKAKNMSEKSKEIRAIVHDLMALEVIEESSTKIVTKDFLNMREIEPQSLVNKMDIITRDMLADAKNTFKEDRSANIAERDGDVNRIFYLIRRSLRYIPKHTSLVKKFNLSHEELMVMWDLSAFIERIADQTKRISKFMRRLKMTDREKKEFVALFALIEKYYIRAMEVYYSKELVSTAQEVSKGIDLLKKCQDHYRANWQTDWVPVIIEEMKIIVASTQALLMDLSDADFKPRPQAKPQ